MQRRWLVVPSAWTLWLMGCASGAGRAPLAPTPQSLTSIAVDTVRTERLSAQAQVHTLVNTTGPWRAYVLDVDMRQCGDVRARKGSANAIGRATTSALLSGMPARDRAYAAINADFFLFAPPGVPTNLHIEDGVLLAGPGPKPVFVTGVDSKGRTRVAMDSVRAEGVITSSRGTIALRAWNRPAPRQHGIVDAHWGVPLDTLVRRRVMRLEPITPLHAVAKGSDTREGRFVARAAALRDTVVAGDTLLLHLAPGPNVIAAGDTVGVRIELLGPAAIGIRNAVGGRPLLLVDSVVTADVDTEGNAGFQGPNPRSAVGMNRDGTRLWFAVIDGRQAGYSMGMSLRQTADLLRALGATRALNLDGGGSSALVVRDLESGQLRVLNKPSDKVERAVGNGLVLLASCAAM